MQSDGNLVRHTEDGFGRKNQNFTVPDPSWNCFWCTKVISVPVWGWWPSEAVWASGTNGRKSGEDKLQITDDGKLFILVNEQVIWDID